MQFIQSVLAGISGLDGTLVREAWQPNPPKEPDVYVNWMKFSFTEDEGDFDPYQSIDSAGNNVFMRMEDLSLQCSFYGPEAWEYAKIVRDGFTVRQNLEALGIAKMTFVSASKAVRAPDLVNERWVNRWEMTLRLRREILRVYPVLKLLLGGPGTLIGNNAGAGTITVAIPAVSEEG